MHFRSWCSGLVDVATARKMGWVSVAISVILEAAVEAGRKNVGIRSSKNGRNATGARSGVSLVCSNYCTGNRPNGDFWGISDVDSDSTEHVDNSESGKVSKMIWQWMVSWGVRDGERCWNAQNRDVEKRSVYQVVSGREHGRISIEMPTQSENASEGESEKKQ